MQRGSSPQRVASVRMTERAVRLLRSGRYARALTELEKSLSTDGTNPYAHYYIAVVHYRLGNFKASLDFLDAAEPILGRDSSWLVQSVVLRGDNLRALGRFGAAGEAYGGPSPWMRPTRRPPAVCSGHGSVRGGCGRGRPVVPPPRGPETRWRDAAVQVRYEFNGGES